MKTLLQLFGVFFKIGAFTFGGGYAMLPLIQKEVVDRFQWMKEDEILDVFAISQSIPGVIAVNSAIFIGKKVRGSWGAIVAASGVILPAFVSILAILTLLIGMREHAVAEKIFTGIRAASAALILYAAVKLGKNAIKSKWGIAIAIGSFLLIVLLDIHAIWAIALGIFTGILMFLLNKRRQP